MRDLRVRGEISRAIFFFERGRENPVMLKGGWVRGRGGMSTF